MTMLADTSETLEESYVPARADVVRMVSLPTTQLEMRDTEDDGRTLTGYAAVFDEWTEIDSFWEGHFLERLDRHAFDNTLAKRGDRVKVLFNHGMDPSIGDKPLGKPSRMEPQEVGLWTETPMAHTSYNDDLIALIRTGAVDGMSFRFRVTDDDWVTPKKESDHNPQRLKERTIKSLDLFEYGPVTFPAYEATTAGIRSADVYRAWLLNPNGFLTPAVGASTGERADADSRAEEPPVGASKKQRRYRADRAVEPLLQAIERAS